MNDLIFNEIKKNSEQFLLKDFAFSPSYNQKRKEALSYFTEHGIPDKKNEDWLYTSPSKHLSFKYSERSADFNTVDTYNFEDKIVFVNGRYCDQLSNIPNGIEIHSPKLISNFKDSFDALNFLASQDAKTFVLKSKINLSKPILLLHLVDEHGINKINSDRINLVLEPFSSAEIIEVFKSHGTTDHQYTRNSNLTIELKENSNLNYTRLILEESNALHIGLVDANIDRSASFNHFLIDLNRKMSRNNLEVNLLAENASCNVYGAYYTKNDEHSDSTTKINHVVSNTFSEQLYKGILANDSSAAFTGKVHVAKDAIGVNSNQLNKNLLLSKKAHINTRPQLLVNADDVKCSHGATVGELSFDEEFYLISRGIEKSKAQKILAFGFIGEIIHKIQNEKIKSFVLKKLDEVGLKL